MIAQPLPDIYYYSSLTTVNHHCFFVVQLFINIQSRFNPLLKCQQIEVMSLFFVTHGQYIFYYRIEYDDIFSEKFQKQKMQYVQPYPSAVPHIILTPSSFEIQTLYYSISVAIQIMFLLFVLVILLLLIASIYQNERLSFEKQISDEQESANNIICNDKNLNDNEGDNFSHELSELSKFDKLQRTRSVWGIDFHEDERVTASNYQFYERKITYFCVYLGIYAISVNSFDCGIITIISLGLQIPLFMVFNVFRCCQNWKITLFLFMIPALMGFFQLFTGDHKLYQWDRVV